MRDIMGWRIESEECAALHATLPVSGAGREFPSKGEHVELLDTEPMIR